MNRELLSAIAVVVMSCAVMLGAAQAAEARSTCGDRSTVLTDASTHAQILSAVVCLSNERRVAMGLPALLRDPRLDAAAQAHADDMSSRDYFDHVSPEGRTPAERAFASGYDGFGAGENIAGTGATAREVVAGWFTSPAHCANLLSGAQDTGVGLAFDAASQWDGTRPRRLRWVQMFGKGSGGTAQQAACPVLSDDDGDGIIDYFDNCPDTPNPGQEDSHRTPNSNRVGDACDASTPITPTTPQTPGTPPVSCRTASARDAAAVRLLAKRRAARVSARRSVRAAKSPAARAKRTTRARAAERAYTRAASARQRTLRARRAACG